MRYDDFAFGVFVGFTLAAVMVIFGFLSAVSLR